MEYWLHSSRISPETRNKIFKFAPSGLPVFIRGEEGTGKGLAAKAVHFLGPLKNSPFLRISCRSLTPARFVEKISLWLKDHKAGKKVSFALYLEDLEDLEDDTQALLFDLLHDQQIHWPGLEGLLFNVQVISSSSCSTAEEITAWKLRGDLLPTLETLILHLKPLRERKEEITKIIEETLQEKGQGAVLQKRFSPEALHALQEYDWPGNLPELESVVLRSASMKEGNLCGPEDLIFTSSCDPLNQPGAQKGEKESWFDLAIPALAHEIKNPLVAISTFAHLLPEKYEDPEFRYEFSRLVNLDVKRINDLLENLLEFTQFPSPCSTPHDLNSLLDEILQPQLKSVEKRGGKVILDLGKRLPVVLFDRTQLNFVFRNLLEHTFSKPHNNVPFHLSTRFSREDGVDGRREFVDLLLGHNGPEGLDGKSPKMAGLEIAPAFQNLSLALLLIRKIMERNRGGMQVLQEEDGGVTIRLRFPIAL
jgi:transcriptional regulator with AAA-type ATPase domain